MPSVQVMTGPLFLVTVSRLTAVLDCTVVPEPVRAETGIVAVLDESLTYSDGSTEPLWDEGRGAWVPCFEGRHQVQLAATMIGLLFFLPSATMASAYFEVPFPSIKLATGQPTSLPTCAPCPCLSMFTHSSHPVSEHRLPLSHLWCAHLAAGICTGRALCQRCSVTVWQVQWLQVLCSACA